MPVVSAVAIYFLVWFLALFAVLPWRVRTSHEAGEERGPGHADSAPHDPRLMWKLKWTTIIATAIFAVFWANYEAGWLTMADLPLPQPPSRAS